MSNGVEGSPIAGRRATAAVANVETARLQDKSTKDSNRFHDLALQVQKVLDQINEHIVALQADIIKLRLELSEANERGEEAFERMHDLQDILRDIENNGFNASNRTELRNAIGPQRYDALNDQERLQAIHEQMKIEQKVGLEAAKEADSIEGEIEAKMAEMDDLIQTRDAISKDPSLSAEEKIAQMQAVLSTASEKSLSAFESTEANGQNSHMSEEDRNNHRTELDETENFDLSSNSTSLPAPS